MMMREVIAHIHSTQTISTLISFVEKDDDQFYVIYRDKTLLTGIPKSSGDELKMLIK